MAKEKNLTTVTSVAAADLSRVVTSAGASVKATFANVAKYIVETYNGSTVAGSAQSVKSALDALNSKTTRYVKTITVSNSKINSAVAFVEQIGSLVLVVFYFTATSAISRGETLYTIDLSTNFSHNYFDRKILLATGTKEVRADAAIAANEVVSGTYIGMVI